MIYCVAVFGGVAIMFDTKKFGAFISRMRKNADMTQSELSDRLNLTRQAVSKYECGDSFPDISTLRRISEIFAIPVELLISSGDPTEGEAKILTAVTENRDEKPESAADVLSLAPFLKPSVVNRLSENLAKDGIDASSIVSLSQYLNDADSSKMMKNLTSSSIGEMDQALLEKLLPVLGAGAGMTVFDKILLGELDVSYLDSVLLCGGISDSLVEEAVVEGALPDEALFYARRYYYNQSFARRFGKTPEIFTCPECGRPLRFIHPSRCDCGFRVPVQRFTYDFRPELEGGSDGRGESADVCSLLDRKCGGDLVIFFAGCLEAALRYGKARENPIIAACADKKALDRLDTESRNINCGNIIFAHMSARDPDIRDGAVDCIVEPEEINEKHIRMLSPGGIIIKNGRTAFEKQ